MKVKCFVITQTPKPKVCKGHYYPEQRVGEYKSGLIKTEKNMQPFYIPKNVKPTIADSINFLRRPFFIVNPTSQIAQPIGKNKLQNGLKIALQLAVNTKKRYVKTMTEKVFDTLQMIILMLAGYGILRWVEDFIKNIT